MTEPDPFSLPIVVRCDSRLAVRARYVLDTLFCAQGIAAHYVEHPPSDGPWLLYGQAWQADDPRERGMAIAHCPQAWEPFDEGIDTDAATGQCDGVPIVLPHASPSFTEHWHISIDLIANAFYFLASWWERHAGRRPGSRALLADSVFVRRGFPQDIVDRYLSVLVERLRALHARCSRRWAESQDRWPGGSYALVLSHDVDFIPSGTADIVVQGVKTVARHVIRQRDPADAWRAAAGLLKALAQGRDPYGCIPDILAREQALGLRASFQVAVGHRHPNDVNYRIEDDRTRDYLRQIVDAGFDLCLHGSYLSTEHIDWYVEEARLLQSRLGPAPIGSRQHFLSFDYDHLFEAQERAGILYDMSMGFPDATGSRVGFSHPYCPFNLRENRPYKVLEIGLVLMDVTLRSYMGLKGEAAWSVIESRLRELRQRDGCASSVWHPIVFGGARDPGFDDLFWRMARHVGDTGGVATDARTIHRHWRARAGRYSSFN